MKNNTKILINDEDVTEKFKTEQDVYLTSTWFDNCSYDEKPFNPEDVRVNGLNRYFIDLKTDNTNFKENRVYFKDVTVFKFNKN